MKYTTFVGLDVHKDTIAVAVAKEGREAAESLGTIINSPEAITKLIRLDKALLYQGTVNAPLLVGILKGCRRVRSGRIVCPTQTGRSAGSPSERGCR